MVNILTDIIQKQSTKQRKA